MRDLLASTFACLFWGFFAYGYTEEPFTLSVSNEDDWIKTFPLEEPAQTSDVGRRFHLFFLGQFYLSAVAIVCILSVLFLFVLQCGF